MKSLNNIQSSQKTKVMIYQILKLVVVLLLLALVFASCSTQRCQPSRKSKDYAGFKAELISIEHGRTLFGKQLTKRGNWRPVFRVQIDSTTFDTLAFSWRHQPIPSDVVVGRKYILSF